MRQWRVGDVMTTDVVSVREETPYRDIVDTMSAHRISAVPVVDSFGRVLGVVSESALLYKIEYDGGGEQRRVFASRRRRTARAKAAGDVAEELMTAPAITAMAGTPVPEAARRMETEHVTRLPVTDDLGRLVGIVTRADLLKVFLRPDEDI